MALLPDVVTFLVQGGDREAPWLDEPPELWAPRQELLQERSLCLRQGPGSWVERPTAEVLERRPCYPWGLRSSLCRGPGWPGSWAGGRLRVTSGGSP